MTIHGRRSAAKGSLLALFVAGSAMLVRAQTRIDWLETLKEVYAVLPPQVVAVGGVDQAQWSSDGTRLLVCVKPSPRTLEEVAESLLAPSGPMRGPTELLEYNVATNRTRTLWSAQSPGDTVYNANWLQGSNTIFATIESKSQAADGSVVHSFGVFAADSASGVTAWIPGMEHLTSEPQLAMSPSRPLVVAAFETQEARGTATAGAAAQAAFFVPKYVPEGAWISPGKTMFWTLGPGGAVVSRASVSPTELDGVAWTADGSQWLFARRDRKTKAVSERRLDEGGHLTPVDLPLYIPPATPPPSLWVHDKPMRAQQRKVARSFKCVWLSSPQPTKRPDALISPDGTMAELSPGNNAVFYVEGGVAKVRPLEKLSNNMKSLLARVLRQQIMSDAKSASLSMLMYSNDMDDNLPGADNLDALEPYLKDMGPLDDFVYTPPTDLNLSHVAEPATTTLGYIDGPDGRAVAYTDGHVKWIPNP